MAAESPAALHRAGPAGAAVDGAGVDDAEGGAVVAVGETDCLSGPDGLLPGSVDCDCGWLGPQAVSIRAAAAAAVDMTNPWKIV